MKNYDVRFPRCFLTCYAGLDESGIVNDIAVDGESMTLVLYSINVVHILEKASRLTEWIQLVTKNKCALVLLSQYFGLDFDALTLSASQLQNRYKNKTKHYGRILRFADEQKPDSMVVIHGDMVQKDMKCK